MTTMQNFKSWLELGLLFTAVVTGIYKLSKLEEAIYRAIDGLKDNINDRLNALNTRVDIHLQDYVNKQEMTTFFINQLDEKINHKAARLHNNQRDIIGFLEKKFDFIHRQAYAEDPDSKGSKY